MGAPSLLEDIIERLQEQRRITLDKKISDRVIRKKSAENLRICIDYLNEAKKLYSDLTDPDINLVKELEQCKIRNLELMEKQKILDETRKKFQLKALEKEGELKKIRSEFNKINKKYNTVLKKYPEIAYDLHTTNGYQEKFKK